MSVNWSWKMKQGEIHWRLRDGSIYKDNFYRANCVGAVIHDFREKDETTGKLKNMYNFTTFWNDYEHLKRCLGLSKSYNYDGEKHNLYEGKIYKVKLNIFYKDMLIVGRLFAEAGFKVELYYKEIK